LLDDEGFEQSTEFVRWASAYTLKQQREAVFETASRRFVDTTINSARLGEAYSPVALVSVAGGRL